NRHTLTDLHRVAARAVDRSLAPFARRSLALNNSRSEDCQGKTERDRGLHKVATPLTTAYLIGANYTPEATKIKYCERPGLSKNHLSFVCLFGYNMGRMGHMGPMRLIGPLGPKVLFVRLPSHFTLKLTPPRATNPGARNPFS